MDNRGLTNFEYYRFNEECDKKCSLIKVDSSYIVFETKSKLSQTQKEKLGLLQEFHSGKNIAYANPFKPLLIFYFENEEEPQLSGCFLKTDKSKTLLSFDLSPIHYNEPHDTSAAIEKILSQRTFGPSVRLQKSFFTNENFWGLSSFASNWSPNFFTTQFVEVRSFGSNYSRFKVYQSLKSYQPIIKELYLYPWGFRYKNFTTWNENIEKLLKHLCGKKLNASLRTLHSIFPKECIKDILVD